MDFHGNFDILFIGISIIMVYFWSEPHIIRKITRMYKNRKRKLLKILLEERLSFLRKQQTAKNIS